MSSEVQCFNRKGQHDLYEQLKVYKNTDYKYYTLNDRAVCYHIQHCSIATALSLKLNNKSLPLYNLKKAAPVKRQIEFISQAYVTGLWKFTKRDKKDVSEQERKEMKNFDTRSCSFWLNLKKLY